LVQHGKDIVMRKILKLCRNIVMHIRSNASAISPETNNYFLPNEIIKNVVFPRGSATGLPSKDRKEAYLSSVPSMCGYIVFPLTSGTSGTVNVTFSQGVFIRKKTTLIADGGFHTIYMSGWPIRAGNVTISYHGASIPLNGINITFSR